jgi:hypothetical protein
MNIDISIDNDTFSEDELKKLLQCTREIEQNRPKRHIDIFIDSPEKSMKEVKRVISSIKPEFPYLKAVEFENETKGDT